MQNSVTTTKTNSFAKISKIGYKTDLFYLILLFTISVLVVYYTSKIFIQGYFLVLLLFFWRSSKNYFWFALFFIFINEPAGFFSGGSASIYHRMPLYSVGQGLSFTFYDFFVIIALLKALHKKKGIKLLFSKPLIILSLYGLVLLLISFVFGINFDTIVALSRSIMFYTLFISIPYLIYKEEDVEKFVHLVFPFVFLIFFGQLYEFVNQQNLIVFFDPSRILEIAKWEGEVRAVMDGVMIIFFSYIFALFYLSKRNYTGKKNYLYLIIIISFLSVIISSTRSWIGMFAVLLIIYFLFIEKAKPKLIVTTSLFIILSFFVYSKIPVLKRAIDTGFNRFSTIEYLIEGDITAGSTLDRYSVRLPRVMEGFKQNPVIGWGFSKTYLKYADGHVGNFNLLLQVGIIGFFFFVYFWYFVYKKTFFIHKKLSNINPYKKSLLVLPLGLTGMLILHFSSYQFFGFGFNYAGISFLALYFSLVNQYIIISTTNYE